MSDPDNFLSRWSRRKRAVAEEENVASAKPPTVESSQTAAGESPARDPAQAGQPARPAGAPAVPEFDVGSLPSIESIGADTDVSVFLKPGVPPALRHAALRRVWVTDPAIRDFRAPQEMDWDFNSPGLPGFGEIGPDVDVKKMAARILGDRSLDEPEPTPSNSSQTASVPEEIAGAAQAQPDPDSSAASADGAFEPLVETSMLQRKENTASQQETDSENQVVLTPRRHGSALPQ